MCWGIRWWSCTADSVTEHINFEVSVRAESFLTQNRRPLIRGQKPLPRGRLTGRINQKALSLNHKLSPSTTNHKYSLCSCVSFILWIMSCASLLCVQTAPHREIHSCAFLSLIKKTFKKWLSFHMTSYECVPFIAYIAKILIINAAIAAGVGVWQE